MIVSCIFQILIKQYLLQLLSSKHHSRVNKDIYEGNNGFDSSMLLREHKVEFEPLAVFVLIQEVGTKYIYILILFHVLHLFLNTIESALII